MKRCVHLANVMAVHENADMVCSDCKIQELKSELMHLKSLIPVFMGGLIINCDFCSKQLRDNGALLFSPPTENYSRKLHLCKDCYHKICEQYNIPKIYNPIKQQVTCCGNSPENNLLKHIEDSPTFC